MKRFFLLIFTVLAVTASAVADDMSAEYPQGQEFPLIRSYDAAVYEEPDKRSALIGVLRGDKVTLLTYDPHRNWATILFTAEDGTMRKGYIEHSHIGSLPRGEKVKIPSVSPKSSGITRPARMSTEDPRGQVFLILPGGWAVREQPHEHGAKIAELPDTGEVTLLNYDPKRGWGTMIYTAEDGTKREAFVNLYDLNFPGGQEIAIPQARLTRGFVMPKFDAEVLYIILFYIMLGIPSLFGILFILSMFIKKLERLHEDSELAFRFIVVTACVEVVFFLYRWIGGVNGMDVEVMYSRGTWDFSSALAQLAIYGLAVLFSSALFIRAWVWFVKWLFVKDGEPFSTKLKYALPSLIFMATTLYLAFLAIRAAFIIILILLGALFLIWITLSVAGKSLFGGIGGGGGSSSGGVHGTCSSCRYYSGDSCRQSGTPTGSGSSCGSYSPS